MLIGFKPCHDAAQHEPTGVCLFFFLTFFYPLLFFLQAAAIQPQSIAGKSGCTCFVFYLPASATNDSLRQLFMRYGTVLNAYVAIDKSTNRPRGFGFVDFATSKEATDAVAGLDKCAWENKFLSVSIKI